MNAQVSYETLRSKLARLGRTLAKESAATSECKYRQDQPRVPAGSPDGGQWVEGAGEPQLTPAAFRLQRHGKADRYTHAELAGAIYNETASLQGPQIDEARRAIAHVAQNRLDAGIIGGLQDGQLSATEQASIARGYKPAKEAYDSAVAASAHALSREPDPTHGALYFFMAGKALPTTFYNHALTQSFGPFTNRDKSGRTPSVTYIGVYGGRKR